MTDPVQAKALDIWCSYNCGYFAKFQVSAHDEEVRYQACGRHLAHYVTVVSERPHSLYARVRPL